jgi:hypothetical protein
MNGDMKVYSFVASDPVTSFGADIKDFWDAHLSPDWRSTPVSAEPDQSKKEDKIQ